MLPDLLSTALRALAFVALLQAAGAVLFLATFGRAAHNARPHILRLARICVLLGAVLVVAQFLLEPARMTGELSGVLDADLLGFALHTRAAQVAGLRLFGLLLIGLSLRRSGAKVRSLGVVGAVLVAVSFAAIGHSTESPLRLLLMPLVALHLLVVAFWFGALLPLIAVGDREHGAIAAAVVARFSRAATWLVPLILIAGLIIGANLLPDPAALGTAYGIGLLLKLAAFALLMGLAGLNKWRLAPALEKGGRSAWLPLRRSITIEFVLIALVAMGTAVLTNFWSPG